MQARRTSKTAEQVALSRAIETCKPRNERICDDPFAERFLGGAYRMLLFARPLRDAVERLIESQFAGHHWYVIARTRYLDDFLQSELARGPEQLVILGAGYDSRAYRFADRLRGAAVFEVDHPATSAAKQAKIRHALGGAAPNVTYVPVDFNAETLAGRLRQSGYRDKRRTVFLWEGVTPYLSGEAVDEVLQFIRSSSASGSVVLFDYIVRSLVDGTCAMRGARNEFERMQKTSEPLVFGIVEGQADAYLAARGFGDVVDVGADDLKTRYFGSNMDRYVKPWWRIVHATVP
jgi:methyltransferase (TIGR00027 family)